MDKTVSAAISPWRVPVVVDDIPDHGMHVEIDAPALIRAEVLAVVDGLSTVREILSLSGVFDLHRRGARVHVTGHVRAKVGQTCVVTLEPMDSTIDETVDLMFAPSQAEAARAGEEIDVTLDSDPPEPMSGGTVDLGALATEFLVLGINPYPRKSDAEFAPVTVGDEGPKAFAALEALKKRLGGGQT
jgi:uncharacterized metal-binding protein YceD (DUF177 family)